MPNHGAGGRRPKPPHLHVVDGTFRKDRHGDKPATPGDGGPEPVIVIPPVPGHLNPGAAEIFLEIAGLLATRFVAVNSFVHLLAEAAANLDVCRTLLGVCEDLGYTYMHPGIAGPTPKMRPEYNAWLKAQARAESLLSRFGLTPADVPKAGAAQGGKQADEFDDL